MAQFFAKQSVGRASAFIAITTLLSYVLGLVRDKILAYYFGTGIAADIYNAGFIIPDLILNGIILGALSGVFIPIFMEAKEEDAARSHTLASTFLNVMSLVVIIVSIVCILLAEPLSYWLAPALSSESMRGTMIGMMRLMLLFPLFVGISNTVGAVLQSYHHFKSYGLSSILYNLGIILGVVVLSPSIGVYGAGIGVIFGFLLHMCIRLWELRSVAFQYAWHWDIRNPDFLRIIRTMPPRVLTLLSTYVVLTVFGLVGLSLSTGALTAITYARNFQSFPINIFGISFATAVLPTLAEHVAKKEGIRFRNDTEKAALRILLFAIPAAVGMFVLAKPAVELILAGGAFGPDSVHMTTSLLMLLCMSIPFESLTHLQARVFYAKKDIWTPTFASIVFMFTAVAMIYFWKDTLGPFALAIGWVSGTVLQCVVLLTIGLLRDVPLLSLKGVGELFLFSAAALVMGVIVQFSDLLGGGTIALMLGALVGTIIYGLVLLLCQSPTAAVVWRSMRKTQTSK